MSADVWEQLYATECIDEGYRAPLDAMRRALEHPKCACKLLDINGRRIGDEGAAIIAQALSSNKSLVSLNMAGNDIGDEGAAIISRALSSNKSLVSLNLYGNNVGDEGATSIAQALSSNKSLVSLNMAGNNIGDEGAASIAQALSSNKSLVSLNLYSNNIGDEGAASIAQALSSNESLVSLNLYSNNIGAEGAASIAQALSSNKSLMSMDISGNNIGAEGAASISRALSSNKSLVSLNLYSNKIGDEGAAIIAQALSSNESLVSLHLYNNNIGDEGAASIAQALSSNKSLVSLNLFCNNIGDKGAASIAQALSSNKSLVSLDLYSNNIGAEGAAIISRALSSNKSLVNQSGNQRGAKGGVCTDTFLLWFSWLACATSPLASLLVLLEGAGADTYVFVGDTRRQTIDLGLGMYLVQLDNPMRDNPLVDLFSIPIEILNSHDQYPCSYPSPMSIAIGNKYFELNSCGSPPSSDLTHKLAPILRDEVPKVRDKVPKELEILMQQEKEFQLYYQKFTSLIDFSCMRDIEMRDIDIPSAKILGVGCNETTSGVMLKPTNDWHIPRMIEQGVALKMMFNLEFRPGSVGTTEHQRNRFDKEYHSLIQHTHWGVANIISFFQSYTQEELIPKDRKMCLVSSETGTPVDPNPHNHPNCVSIYDRTTFIIQELGSTTLEKHMQQLMLPAAPAPYQQNLATTAATTTTATILLPLGMDKTLESTFQLLATVDHLNNTCGLFHLDIKSDNILFLERSGFTGQFTVLRGFGTSVSINNPSSESGGSSAPGMLVLGQNEVPEGSILNRAPEALRPVSLQPSDRSSTYNVSKTDLWAVGCVVWQMCFGTTPFTSEAAITSEPLTIPAGLLRECPCLFNLLEQVFDRNPESRPSARLASIFVGSHIFLAGINDLVTRIESTALSSLSAESTIDLMLSALRSQTQSSIHDLMEQQTHLDWKERTISVRLFLQMVFPRARHTSPGPPCPHHFLPFVVSPTRAEIDPAEALLSHSR